MFNLGTMTTPQIVALYNNMAPAPVKKFETRTIAIARTQKLLDAQAQAEAERAAAAEAVRKAERDAEAARATAADEAFKLEAAAYQNQLAEVKRLQAAEKASIKSALGKSRRPVAAEPVGVLVAGPAPKAAAPAKAAKPAKPAPEAKPGKITEFGLSGTKLALLNMMRRQEGVSEAEGCEALNWAKCTATILKVAAHVEPQGLTMHRWRGETGKTRYRLVPSNSGI